MLMFAEMSGFIYDFIVIFHFPTQTTVDIYSKENFIKCFVEIILTDTDSCLLF